MRRSSNVVQALVLAALLSTLAGCSEYLDRRDTNSLQSGNAVQTNKITQMVDPWPRASADRNIASNGVVMQSAVERYRTGRVIPPNSTGTSSSFQGAPPSNAAPLGPTVNQPTAPVK